MEADVKIKSDEVELSGTYFTRDRRSPGKMPGLVLGHGFAGALYPKMASHLASLGYAVLSIEFRGYGRSGGERGRVVPSDQVSDFRNSLSWLAGRPEIDPDRLGIIGSSLGGTVAIMAAAQDPRMKICVAGCPISKGDTTLRMLYDTPEKYAAFMKTVERKAKTGEKLHRFEIVLIPENLRGNLPKGTPMEFSTDTVYGFLSLNPKQVISQIAPRPLFIIHAKDDHVVPYQDAEELAVVGGKNCELELIETGDHFIFGKDDVIQSIARWLGRKFPVA